MADTPIQAPPPVRVIVAGAGPAGCLAAHHLLLRDRPYHVTLVDGRPNPASVALNLQRSWMIGLSSHGLNAVKRIPGLFDAIKDVGLSTRGAKLHFGKRAATILTSERDGGLVVDRNWIVAGMVGHMLDNIPHPDRLSCLWNAKCLFVDPAAHTVTVRVGDKTETLEYDLLLGCDGVRSVVRAAFMQDRDFEVEVTDVFGYFKSVHLNRPAGFDESFVHFMPFAWPNLNSIILPEVNGSINLAAGYNKSKRCAPELFSSDPAVVEKYLRDHFTAHLTLDWRAFAEQWVKQGWSSTGQVKCSTYHLLEGRALLLGDAAHATSPAIGSGMNTALDDAAKLNDLLDQYDDDLAQVLPAFTALRLKEGHALVDLSFNNFAFNGGLQLALSAWQIAQSLAHKASLGLIPDFPLTGLTHGVRLSEVYREMSLRGPLNIVRHANSAVRRTWFERHSGLIPAAAAEPGMRGLLGAPLLALGSAILSLAQAAALILALPLRVPLEVARQWATPRRPLPPRALPTLPIPWLVLQLFSLPWCITKHLQQAPEDDLPDLRDTTGESPHTMDEVVPGQLWCVHYTYQTEPLLATLFTGGMKDKRTQGRLLERCTTDEQRGQMQRDIESCLACASLSKQDVRKGGLLKAGMKMESHMWVARLAGTPDLLLYSPVKISDEVAAWLAPLGTVKWVVSPSSAHTLFVKSAARRYPEAAVVAGTTAAVKIAKAGVKVTYNYGVQAELDEVQRQLHGSFEVTALPGDPIQELNLLHLPTRTLLICDLLYTNHPEGMLAQPEMKAPEAWSGRLFYHSHCRPEFAGGLLPAYRYHALETSHFPAAPRPPPNAKALLWPALARLMMTPDLARVCSAHQPAPLAPPLARQLLRTTWGWMQEDLQKEAEAIAAAEARG